MIQISACLDVAFKMWPSIDANLINKVRVFSGKSGQSFVSFFAVTLKSSDSNHIWYMINNFKRKIEFRT